MSLTNVRVRLSTSKGDILLELDGERAPVTVQNFISYVDKGFYDGLVFHRVIKGFMIQGGGLDADMRNQETGQPIRNEADNGLRNERGTIAMARTNDPHSATAQFFINHANNGFLDHTGPTGQGWGYAVFGRVVDGLDVVDAIADIPTGTRGGHQDVPTETISIVKVERIEA